MACLLLRLFVLSSQSSSGPPGTFEPVPSFPWRSVPSAAPNWCLQTSSRVGYILNNGSLPWLLDQRFSTKCCAPLWQNGTSQTLHSQHGVDKCRSSSGPCRTNTGELCCTVPEPSASPTPSNKAMCVRTGVPGPLLPEKTLFLIPWR